MPDFMTITPPEKRNGWAGPKIAQKSYDKIGHLFTPFFIAKQTVASDNKRVLLWEFAKLANNGKHLPTFIQEIGDCISQGAANAIGYLQCVEIAKLKQPEKYKQVYQPYIYGCSRVFIGKGQINLNNDGGAGIWAAQACRQFGVISATEPGVPQYSGQIATQWGKYGPPPKFITLGKKHVIRSASRVTTYQQVRDAIANGYPVTVASDRGFREKGVVYKGKLWGTPYGEWLHQMCFIGVDDDQSRPGCYCMNSWGPNMFGISPDGAPPGGFWVDANVVDYMVRQGDSWAYSSFDGFPEQNLDFLLISQKAKLETVETQKAKKPRRSRKNG